jgi:hypothetical protein
VNQDFQDCAIRDSSKIYPQQLESGFTGFARLTGSTGLRDRKRNSFQPQQ